MKRFFKERYRLLIAILVFGSLLPINLIRVYGESTASYPISYPEAKGDNTYADNLDQKSRDLIKSNNDKLKDNKYKNNYLIKFKDTTPASVKLNKKSLKGSNNNLVSTNDNSILNSPYVDKSENDAVLVTESLTYNDPMFGQQNYLTGIGFLNYLNTTTPVSKVVAVIDSGICNNHPDLAGRIMDGWNFVDENANTDDSLGHGCMVSGIIAANSNNSIGIVGAAPSAKIMPLKIIDSDGVGSYSNLIRAINFAVDAKVDIINISLGGIQNSDILHEVIKGAIDKGIKVVASAGNTGNTDLMYPAAYPEVISVGSVEYDYTISPYSSSSKNTTIWTYGTNLISTKGSDYSTESGTSFAAALATAFIADGGEYTKGKVMYFVDSQADPVFTNNLATYSEDTTNLTFKVPSGLKVSESGALSEENLLINWSRMISLSRTESLSISVWHRKEAKSLNKIIDHYAQTYKCDSDKVYCTYGLPKVDGNYATFIQFIKLKTNLVMLKVDLSNFTGYSLFKRIIQTLKIDNKLLDKNLSKLVDQNLNFPKTLSVQVDNCGGYPDEGNPFICCAATDSDHNNANCTWWAASKRHDIWNKISGDAGTWYSQAEPMGFTVSTTAPVPGSIITWAGHVAYVTSVDTSNNTVTWSEMNCLTYWTEIDANGNKIKHYGVNAQNDAVNRSYPNKYGGTFYGFILPSGSSESCSGNNPVMNNWNESGNITCNPQGNLTINPESSLIPSGSSIITINPT